MPGRRGRDAPLNDSTLNLR